MQHTKRRLTGPHGTGFVSHVLIQRHGFKDFRRLYRAHKDDPRSQTAAALRRARREIRANVAEWAALIESERQHIAKLLKKQQQSKKTVD